jgi:exopolyphosphatase / guanosine-5'-triphosphate,3'-diphosphate pyrophosphatase
MTATRWEWRTFGDDFGAVGEDAANVSASAVQESDEVYFLAAGGENVKIRDGVLDIKVLRETDGVGLQRWEPVLKAAFPLSRSEVAGAFEALRQPLPPLGRDAYTLEQFEAELIEPSGAVRAVPVHKRRVRHTVRGCMAELSDIVAAGRSTRTIAIETEDPSALWSTVKAVGLNDHLNRSVPEGLAALVEAAPPRYAVIDCGTNSVKFHIAEHRSDGDWTTIVDRAEVTRLGEGLERTGAISTEAIDRTAAAIGEMVDEARRHDVRIVAAVGTAGLRSATNRDDVVRAVEAATGIEIRVISGEEESRLAYQAVREGLGPVDGSLVVFDTGGGSTQFTFGDAATVQERYSVDVGAVRYTEQFGLAGAVGVEGLEQALERVAADLARLDGRPTPDALVGMGGTITNLIAVELGLAIYDADRVRGATLERAEIERQIELYRTKDTDARRAIVGLQPKRADVILAGACIVRTVLDLLGCERLTVSDRGLRHGLLVERFGSSSG